MNDEIEQEADKFQQWFGKSKIKSNKNIPKVLYHGTLSVFDTFNPEKSDCESFWGPGFYFTDKTKDVSKNYANINGADFCARKERIIEKINDEEEEKIGGENDTDDVSSLEPEKYAEMEALRRLEVSHDGLVMPVYLKMENPFVDDKTKWEYSIFKGYQEDSLEIIDYLKSKKFINFCKKNIPDLERYEVDSISSLFSEYINYNIREGDFVSLIDFKDYLISENNISSENSELILNNLQIKFEDYILNPQENDNITERFKSFIIDKINIYQYNPKTYTKRFEQILNEYLEAKYEHYEEHEFSYSASDFIYFLREESHEFFDPDCEQHTFMGSVSEFLIIEGYDGIIMNASKAFKDFNIAIPSNTSHFICFNANQIKSAIGNNGNYSKEDHNILLRIAEKNTEMHPLMDISKIKQHILEFNENMENFIKFRIFDSIEDAKLFLPKAPDINTKGFYNSVPGQEFIGIIRNNIENKNDLLTTYVHEAVGHSSVKKILGDDYKPTMIKLFNYYNKKHQKEFNPQQYTFLSFEQKINKAEEFLALSIERKFNSGFSGIKILVGAVINKVRKFIPEIPITSFDMEYMEKAAFEFYQKNELKDINVINKIKEEINGRNLTLNMPVRNKIKKNRR